MWRHLTASMAMAAVIVAADLFRRLVIEDPAWAAACAAGPAGAPCLARGTILWFVGHHWLGTSAILAGLAAFFRPRPLALPVAAVMVGALAVIFYSPTWGMIGAGLAVVAWAGPIGLRPRAQGGLCG